MVQILLTFQAHEVKLNFALFLLYRSDQIRIHGFGAG